ncbi:MAG: DedA family protein [SAR324 cluster bacterium]|nr:DedA family protein [SAR324 cluster bacterium]
MNEFVETYGYLALLIGTFLEGETILILAGFAAHRGYLELHWVIMTAFAGSLCGDQLFFFIGRFRGQSYLAKRPKWQPRIDRVNSILERHQIWLILGFRFMYGLRNIIPFVLGSSRIKTAQFLILNVIGAVVWAVLVGLGGYIFGHTLELALEKVKQYEIFVMVSIAGLGLLLWLFHFWRQRH